jgi:hypothetical protein
MIRKRIFKRLFKELIRCEMKIRICGGCYWILSMRMRFGFGWYWQRSNLELLLIFVLLLNFKILIKKFWFEIFNFLIMVKQFFFEKKPLVTLTGFTVLQYFPDCINYISSNINTASEQPLIMKHSPQAHELSCRKLRCVKTTLTSAFQ